MSLDENNGGGTTMQMFVILSVYYVQGRCILIGTCKNHDKKERIYNILTFFLPRTAEKFLIYFPFSKTTM